MKKILCYFSFAAAICAASCTNESEGISAQGATNGKAAINVSASLNNNLAGQTRGTPIQGTNYLNSTLVPNMKVWGYFTTTATGEGISKGDQYVGTGGAGVMITNKSTESPVSNLWDYANDADVVYWPTANLNFYAIIPGEDASFTTSVTKNHDLGHVIADVTIPTTVANQKDILFAHSESEAPRTGDANTPVAFTFNHALSQVVFKGKLASSNLDADIESITIANVEQKGKVGFLTDDDDNTVILGSSIDASHTVADYSAGLIASPTLSGASNVDTAKDLTADDGALMMLPQDRTSDVWGTTSAAAVTIANADANKKTYLAISCKITNGSVYVMGSSSAYETVYIPFEINWEQGKKYTYTLIFGTGTGGYDEDGKPLSSLLPIKYTVSSVTDWTAASTDDIEF